MPYLRQMAEGVDGDTAMRRWFRLTLIAAMAIWVGMWLWGAVYGILYRQLDFTSWVVLAWSVIGMLAGLDILRDYYCDLNR